MNEMKWMNEMNEWMNAQKTYTCIITFLYVCIEMFLYSNSCEIIWNLFDYTYDS